MWRIDWPRLNADARTLLQRLNLDIDVTRLLSSYSVAVQQMVAIARALSVSARVLILDEPTSSLDEGEVKQLFDVLRRLRGEGLAILFVTHFLDQMYAISDRITVLRNGERVGEYREGRAAAGRVDPRDGRARAQGRCGGCRKHRCAATVSAAPVPADATPALQATSFGRRGLLHPVDLQLRRGEVVGLGGLLGSGRTELARLLFGLERPDSGELRVQGAPGG